MQKTPDSAITMAVGAGPYDCNTARFCIGETGEDVMPGKGVMRLRFLGSGGSNHDGCPTLFANDQGSYVVLGWKTDRPDTVEVPHLLTGFAEPGTYIGTMLRDSGRGTFLLTGCPVASPEVLGQMTMEAYETAIEVPKAERTYFGAISTES
ncbi:hypothetical protein [Nocardia terpenica]|nr:hypothetical protein [Nocardia terpenica]